MPLIPVDHDPFEQTAPQGDLARQVSGYPQRAADMLMSFLGPVGEAGMTVGDMLRTGHVDPRDIPQVIGGVMMGVAAPEAEEAAPLEAGAEAVAKGITAYHGSPYDFDKFDLSKIGTGEGAQAYGHGLYFAENPSVAETYAQQLAQKARTQPIPADIRSALKSVGDLGFDRPGQALNVFRDILAGKDSRQNWDLDRPEDAAAVKTLFDYAAQPRAQEHRYEVSINADPEHFLDWDKPLSEQSSHVQQAVTNAGLAPQEPDLGEFAGQKISGTPRWADTPEQMKALRQAGIPGIKYLDQGSRGSGNGTSNYVVFDDKLIDIIKKYGLAGLIAGGGAHFSTQPVDHDPF